MIESDIYRNTAAEHHHHGTHGTTTHGAHSGDIDSNAATDSTGADNEHDHRDEEIEPKGRKETMKDRTAPTLTALALVGIIGLISAVNARAATIGADINDGTTIQNAIGRIATDPDINITREETIGKININYIECINRNDIIGIPATADIVISDIKI